MCAVCSWPSGAPWADRMNGNERLAEIVDDFKGAKKHPVWGRALDFAGDLWVARVHLDRLARETTGADRLVVDQVLLPPERRQYCRFSLPGRRTEWLGGRLAAKEAVLRLLGGGVQEKAGLSDWLVLADEQGKPFAEPQGSRCLSTPHISITHSGSQALAMAATGPCGIDIQVITPTVLKVRSRFAHKAEQELLCASRATKGLDAVHCLTLLWCAKEAVRKMVSVTPLIGFKELLLTGVSGAGGDSGELLFCMQWLRSGRQQPQENSFKVVTMFENDFAVGLSALNKAPGAGSPWK